MVRQTALAVAAMALAQCGSAAVVKLPIWFRNTYAMTELAVGTPPVNHLLFFDTGSGSSWIVDTACADGACRNGSGYPRYGYDANASSTSLGLGIYDSIDYMGGKTGGPAMADMFHAGDQSWNQTFLAANQTSWSFIPGDGFFGMAFSTIAQPRTEVVVETMIREGILDEPKFAMYYGKEFRDTGDGPGDGAITLGVSEEAKYVDGDLTWLPGRKDNGTVYQLWRSTLHEVRGRHTGSAGEPVAAEALTYPPGRANGVFDTGTGVFSVPKAALNPLYKAIGWPSFNELVGGKFMPLCSYFNSTWAVDFAFSDDGVHYSNITVTGDQFRGNAGFAGRDDACEPPFSESGSDSLYLFGQSVLRHVYSVYDYGATEVKDYKPRIGWGKLKEKYFA